MVKIPKRRHRKSKSEKEHTRIESTSLDATRGTGWRSSGGGGFGGGDGHLDSSRRSSGLTGGSATGSGCLGSWWTRIRNIAIGSNSKDPDEETHAHNNTPGSKDGSAIPICWAAEAADCFRQADLKRAVH